MKGLGDLSPALKAIRNSKRILGEEECDCGEIVKHVEIIQPFGPNKGEPLQYKEGCKCEDIELAKQAVRNHEQNKRAALLKAFEDRSLVNAETLKAEFKSFVPQTELQGDLFKKLKSYALNIKELDPVTWILSGQPGRGKSHLAYATARNVSALGSTSLFVDVNNLLRKVKSSWDRQSDISEEQLMSYVGSVDLLVLDDLGAEYERKDSAGKGMEDWGKHKIFEILEMRTGKHNIITTNLTQMQLIERYGGTHGRNVSRLFNNAQFWEVDGNDYRLM